MTDRLRKRDEVIEQAQKAVEALPEHVREGLRHEFDRAEEEGRRIHQGSPQPEDYSDALENLNNAPVGSIVALYAIGSPYAEPRAAIRGYDSRGRWSVTGIEHLFTPEDLLRAWTYEALR